MAIRTNYLSALLVQGDALQHNEIIIFISEDKFLLYHSILIWSSIIPTLKLNSKHLYFS